jgi:RNA polymerase sigma factor (sigma-70 family)
MGATMGGSSTDAGHQVAEIAIPMTVPFEDFVRSESARLFRALYLITGNRHESEEIMQDAFLAVWERWDRVGAMDDPTGYLFRTAMNAVRRRARRASMAIRRVVAPPPPEDPFSQVDARRDVVRALADLDRKQRAAIVLTGLLGYSSEEAGKMLGMSAGSVRVLASRARSHLRDAMGEES